MTKTKHFSRSIRDYQEEIKTAVPADTMAVLRKKSAWRHFSITLRQLFLIFLASYLIIQFPNSLIWIPCSIVLGIVAFGWTILLHEAIHGLIFATGRPRLSKWIAFWYGVGGGMSGSQFRKWHFDHHAELGHAEDDPKRAHLTPKIIQRWYKLLYMTPVLLIFYARASAKETQTYPQDLRKQIRNEKTFMWLFHLTVAGCLTYFFDFATCWKIHLFPYFFIFPIVFTINRVGQHYNIDPENPLKWTTLMSGGPIVDFIHIYSNYHFEHHYYPAIPCYNLPRLHQALQPYFAKHSIQPQKYMPLLYSWLVENKVPYTNWLLD